MPPNVNFNLDRRITLAAWIKRGAESGDTTMPVLSGRAFLLEVSSTSLACTLRGNNGNTAIETENFSFEADIWYHVAAIFNFGLLRVYINGQSQGNPSEFDDPNVALLDSSETETYVGRNTDTGQLFFGQIDDVRIYSRALADEAELQILNSITEN